MQFELFFKIGYACTIPKGVGWVQGLTQLQSYSSGFDEMDDYFATEADTMMDIVCEVDLNRHKV